MNLLDAAVSDLHEEIRQGREARLAKRRALADELRLNALMAIGRLSEALRDPMNPSADLKEAKHYFDNALMAAFRMEPDDFDEDNMQNGRS